MPPLSSKAGKNYQQAFGSVHGFDPYAGSGFVPNFVQFGGKLAGFKQGDLAKTNSKTPKQAISTATLSSAQIQKAGEFIKRQGGLIMLDQAGYNASQYGVLTAMGKNVPKQLYQQPSKGKKGLSAERNMDLTNKLFAKAGGKKVFKNTQLFNKAMNMHNFSVGVSLPEVGILGKNSTDSHDKIVDREIAKIKEEISDDLNGTVKNLSSMLIDPVFGTKLKKNNQIYTKYGKGKQTNDMIGVLAEMAVRGGLDEVVGEQSKEDQTETDKGSGSGAAFDFTGAHASKIAETFNMGKLIKAIEFKLSHATAISGGIPSKVIKGAAHGYIPNFANPLADAINREKGAGVPVSQIRVGSHQSLMNKGNPLGLGVTNTTDEPNGLRDVFGANGYVPNYFISKLRDKVANSSFGKGFSEGADPTKLPDYQALTESIENLTKNQNEQTKDVKKLRRQLQEEQKKGKNNLQTKRDLDAAEKKLARTTQRVETKTSQRTCLLYTSPSPRD